MRIEKSYTVTVNGNPVPNIRIAARMIGLKYTTLYNRVMRNNHALDAIINGFSVTVKEFKTI